MRDKFSGQLFASSTKTSYAATRDSEFEHLSTRINISFKMVTYTHTHHMLLSSQTTAITRVHTVCMMNADSVTRKHRQSYRHADPRRQQQHIAVAAHNTSNHATVTVTVIV